MSLKGFHLLFITCANLLTLGFAYWLLTQYYSNEQPAYLISMVITVLIAAGLIGYEIKFIQKTKSIQ